MLKMLNAKPETNVLQHLARDEPESILIPFLLHVNILFENIAVIKTGLGWTNSFN